MTRNWGLDISSGNAPRSDVPRTREPQSMIHWLVTYGTFIKKCFDMRASCIALGCLGSYEKHGLSLKRAMSSSPNNGRLILHHSWQQQPRITAWIMPGPHIATWYYRILFLYIIHNIFLIQCQSTLIVTLLYYGWLAPIVTDSSQCSFSLIFMQKPSRVSCRANLNPSKVSTTMSAIFPPDGAAKQESNAFCRSNNVRASPYVKIYRVYLNSLNKYL